MQVKTIARVKVMAAAYGACFALVGATQGALAKKPAGAGNVPSSGKSIVENASLAKDESTFVTAVKAAGLNDTLSGPGPFTVFVPTNEAFANLPAGTVDNLLRPENKMQLKTVLSYHVVPGALTTRDIVEQIRTGGGKAQLKTVQGELLTAELKGRAVTITDVKGDVAHLTVSNVTASNGVIQVINTILLP